MINLIHYTRHLNMRFRIDRIKDMVVDVDLSGALILSFTVFLNKYYSVAPSKGFCS